jgi:hypothetical protein
MIESKDETLVKMVINKIKMESAHKNHINMDMRDRCAEVLQFAKQNLSVLAVPLNGNEQ